MGIDVSLVLVEQRGSSPRRRRTSLVDAVLDLHDKFTRLCESSVLPMLSRVDPYGTLILTSSEMDQFISEIEVEFLQAEDSAVRDFLQGALVLARGCREKEEMQLRLDGD